MQVTDGVGEGCYICSSHPSWGGLGGRHGDPSSIQITTGERNAAPSSNPVYYLNVLLADKPGSVGQDLVDLTEPAEFGGDAVQPPQPQGVSAHPQELQHMKVHQVATPMPGSCLQEPRRALRSVGKTPPRQKPPRAPNPENRPPPPDPRLAESPSDTHTLLLLGGETLQVLSQGPAGDKGRSLPLRRMDFVISHSTCSSHTALVPF